MALTSSSAPTVISLDAYKRFAEEQANATKIVSNIRGGRVATSFFGRVFIDSGTKQNIQSDFLKALKNRYPQVQDFTSCENLIKQQGLTGSTIKRVIAVAEAKGEAETLKFAINNKIAIADNQLSIANDLTQDSSTRLKAAKTVFKIAEEVANLAASLVDYALQSGNETGENVTFAKEKTNEVAQFITKAEVAESKATQDNKDKEEARANVPKSRAIQKGIDLFSEPAAHPFEHLPETAVIEDRIKEKEPSWQKEAARSEITEATSGAATKAPRSLLPKSSGDMSSSGILSLELSRLGRSENGKSILHTSMQDSKAGMEKASSKDQLSVSEESMAASQILEEEKNFMEASTIDTRIPFSKASSEHSDLERSRNTEFLPGNVQHSSSNSEGFEMADSEEEYDFVNDIAETSTFDPEANENKEIDASLESSRRENPKSVSERDNIDPDSGIPHEAFLELGKAMLKEGGYRFDDDVEEETQESFEEASHISESLSSREQDAVALKKIED